MLVTLKELLDEAKVEHKAVGAFNGTTLEAIRGIIQAAEELNSPVILQHAQSHDDLIDLEEIGPVMKYYAERAKVPVALHLDHGSSFDRCVQALKLGFTSVMYDASAKSFEENAAETAEIVKIAHAVGASVEAELGHIFTSKVVQGEGGIYPAQKEFLEGLRALCDEKDIILIFDEIQCGMGRTGYYFAWQSYGVQPDVMTCAKALGCGVPVGAFVLGEKAAAASLVPGDHGTTYGGNPFVCAAVSKVFDIFEQDNILAHVQELTPYLEEKLDALVDKCPIVTARRGKGFMQGLVIEGTTVGSVVTKALANGLLVISAGSDVLRLVPPLVITKEHIDEMIEKLEKSLA